MHNNNTGYFLCIINESLKYWMKKSWYKQTENVYFDKIIKRLIIIMLLFCILTLLCIKIKFLPVGSFLLELHYNMEIYSVNFDLLSILLLLIGLQLWAIYLFMFCIYYYYLCNKTEMMSFLCVCVSWKSFVLSVQLQHLHWWFWWAKFFGVDCLIFLVVFLKWEKNTSLLVKI